MSLADWPFDYAEIEPYYERAEWEFGVSGNAAANPFGAPRKRGYPNPAHPDRTASVRFKQGAKKLGYHPFPTPMAINSRPYDGRIAPFGAIFAGFGRRSGLCQGKAHEPLPPHIGLRQSGH